MNILRFDVEPLPDYIPEYGLMLAMMQDGTREWRDELGEIEPEGIVWQVAPGSYSIGGVLLHIAECEVHWFESFLQGKEMDPAEEKLLMCKEIQQYEGKWPTPPKEPLSYYYEILDGVRTRTLETFKSMGDPSAMRANNHGREEVSVGWVLSHVVTHESYHGGQAVLLKELYRRSKG
jgi:uncharacterized damage-inducible protein DinB